MNDETGQTNNPTGKYIIEVSKLNRLHQYMNSFELEYGNFECKPYMHQLENKFQFTMEDFLKNLEANDIKMKTTHSSNMIEPIVN